MHCHQKKMHRTDAGLARSLFDWPLLVSGLDHLRFAGGALLLRYESNETLQEAMAMLLADEQQHSNTWTICGD